MMDYLDADVAYLLGLITARGQLLEQPGDYRIVIQFPGSSITVQGVETAFDQPTEIKLGLIQISDRLRNLLETDNGTVGMCAPMLWDSFTTRALSISLLWNASERQLPFRICRRR